MKKAVIIAAAITLAGGGAATASTFGHWFSPSYSSSHSGGHHFQRSVRIRDTLIQRLVGAERCLIRSSGRCRNVVTPGDGGGSTSDVPVPAAGFLLIAGLGAFALTKRRK